MTSEVWIAVAATGIAVVCGIFATLIRRGVESDPVTHSSPPVTESPVTQSTDPVTDSNNPAKRKAEAVAAQTYGGYSRPSTSGPLRSGTSKTTPGSVYGDKRKTTPGGTPTRGRGKLRRRLGGI
ncbi:hypothetical protein SUDANB1_00437 [Streptomyces sp. enrichment culture]